MTFKAQQDWKILNKLDKPGEVTVRKMTPEEVEKYGKPNEIKPIQGYRWKREEKGMRIGEVTTAQILEVCLKHGTGVEAQKIIADKYGVDKKAVGKTIWNRKIKEKLEALKEMENRIMEGNGTREPVGILSEVEEHSLGLSETKSERPHEDYLDAIAFANEIRDRTAKQRLRPKTLLSQNICGFEYELRDECLLLHADINVDLEIAWGSLDDFIKDLQEIKIIAEE